MKVRACLPTGRFKSRLEYSLSLKLQRSKPQLKSWGFFVSQEFNFENDIAIVPRLSQGLEYIAFAEASSELKQALETNC